ncbi:MAG: hypothetical protein IJY55_04980 [Clostridia bacterium]|nr:hypothetical protein [Clostridia bacterium]
MLKKYVKPEAEMKSFEAIEKIASNLNDWTSSRGSGLGLGNGSSSYTTSYRMSSLVQQG